MKKIGVWVVYRLGEEKINCYLGSKGLLKIISIACVKLHRLIIWGIAYTSFGYLKKTRMPCQLQVK